MDEFGKDVLSLHDYFKLLRGSSTFEPQVCTLDNNLIINASKYNVQTHGIKNIFTTVATFTEGSRVNNSFRELNVLFAEIDDMLHTPKHVFVLKPTFLVRTSRSKDSDGKMRNSYHAYWVLDEPIRDRIVAGEYLLLIRDVLSKVIDNGAMKTAQLLRPPYTMRHKIVNRGGEESISHVEVIYYNAGLTYSLNDFQIWHKLGAKTRTVICNTPKPNKRSEADFAAMIGLLESGADTKLIQKVFTYAPIGNKFREKGMDYFNLTLENAKARAKDAGVAHNVREVDSYLRFDNGDKEEDMTDFLIDYKATLEPSIAGYKVFHEVSINGNTLFFSSEDIADKKRFARVISGINVNLFCKQHRMDEMQKYIVALGKDVDNIKTYTPYTGILKHRDIYERVPSAKSSLVFNPTDKSQLSSVKYEMNRGSPEGLDKVVSAFVSLNDEVATTTMLGWFTLTFFKSFIDEEELGYSFPIMMVGGSANSGKTTIITQLFKLFGLKNVNDSALGGKVTEFVFTRALGLSPTSPVYLKEVRANDGTAAAKMSELLRVSYDSAIARRGTANQDIMEYKLWRPIIADGQDTFLEIAMIGRTLTVYVEPDKRVKSNLIDYLDAYSINNTLSYNLINKIIDDMNLNRDELIANIRQRYSEMIKGLSKYGLDDRSKSNLGLLWFGVTYLYDFVGLEYPDKEMFLQCYIDIFDSRTNYLRSDATVILEYILSQKSKPKAGANITIGNSDEKDILVFNLASKVRSYNQHILTSGMARTNVLSYPAYNRLLKSHGLFVRSIGRGMWELDLEKAKKYGLGE